MPFGTSIHTRNEMSMTPVVYLSSWRYTHSDVMVTTCTSMVTLPAKKRSIDLMHLRLPGYESAEIAPTIPLGKKRKHYFFHRERTAFLTRLSLEREDRASIEIWAATKMQSVVRGFLTRMELGQKSNRRLVSRDISKKVISAGNIRAVLLEMSELAERQLTLDAAANKGDPLAKRKAAWSLTKRKQKKRRKLNKKIYSIRIQSIVRGYLARCAVRKLRSREEEIVRRSFVLKIQACARGHFVRSGTTLKISAYSDHSAVVLQAFLRGWITRIKLKCIRHEIRDEVTMYKAALRIQKIYRGRQARRESSAIQMEKNATKLQSRFRGHRERKMARQKEKAATKISAGFKGSKARKDYSKRKLSKQEAEKHEAAIALQKVARGYNTRNLMRLEAELRGQQAREQAMKVESSAATKIQAAMRGKKSRGKVREIRREKERGSAATRIQSIHRGREGRKRKSIARHERNQTDAAIKIQSIHRGNKARKETEETRIKKHEDLESSAALSIQRVLRGRTTRNKVKAKRDIIARKRTDSAAASVQKVYRGYRARKEVAVSRSERRAALEKYGNDVPKRAIRRAGRK